jgi:hypothetical protein
MAFSVVVCVRVQLVFRFMLRATDIRSEEPFVTYQKRCGALKK